MTRTVSTEASDVRGVEGEIALPDRGHAVAPVHGERAPLVAGWGIQTVEYDLFIRQSFYTLARWSMTLSSKVNLPRLNQFPSLVWCKFRHAPPPIWGHETLVLHQWLRAVRN